MPISDRLERLADGVQGRLEVTSTDPIREPGDEDNDDGFVVLILTLPGIGHAQAVITDVTPDDFDPERFDG